MATAEVQREVLKALRQSGVELSMGELVERAELDAPHKRRLIQVAILFLLSVHKVEFTPARKLRLARA